VPEIKTQEMRDIRSDLEDRADWIQRQIMAEQAQFETLITRVKEERANRLEELKPQLQAVSALIRFATWHHDVRMALTRAIALAATAEIAARRFSETQAHEKRTSISPASADTAPPP
jgi:alanyl-tRNA synthetase